jgi:hypothetical protein
MKKRKITEQEWEEFTLMAIRSVDYPWNLTLEGWYQAVKAEPVIEKTKQNAESRKRSIEKHLNESRRQNAQRRKSIAFDIAARLMQQDRTLRTPRKKSELARRIRTQWPRGEPPPPHLQNLRRWLTEK